MDSWRRILDGKPRRTHDLCGLTEGTRDAEPVHRVDVDGFWMDRTDVTNAQFARFVKATGYVTIAEKAPLPADFPGVPLDQLGPGFLGVHTGGASGAA